MTRGRWAGAILAAWVASLGWLVKRELFRPAGSRLAEAALSVPPGTAYYRVAVGGQQVGFASTTVDTSGNGLRVEDLLVLDIPALGSMHRTSVRTRAILSRAFRLQKVDAVFGDDAGRFATHGTVTGDSTLTMLLVAGRDSQQSRVRFERPIVLPSLLPLRLALGGRLRTGKTNSIRVFDPLLLADKSVGVTVAAESTLVVADSAGFDSTAGAWQPARFDSVRAFRIDQQTDGMRSTIWIDAAGQVVRAAGPVGYTLERAAFEIAYDNFRRRDTARVARASATSRPGDVIAATAVAAGAPLSPRALSHLRVRLKAVDLAGLDLTGGRQRLSGDTLEVRRDTGAALVARYLLPATDTTLRASLEPGPLMQSDNPRIRALARAIVRRSRDPTVAAERLQWWVSEHVDRRPAAAVASAVRVLERRRGDCNEHTVLYVALARAVGLPARTVAGLLYVGGRFYHHAWAEVYLGDWIAVDPTLGQFPADAAHLRVAVGALARQAVLVPLIGGLTLEVL